jgi:uncharacterized repeat protein (TIGR04138 family)
MNFRQKVEEIIRRDSRFKYDAYEFVMQALVYAQNNLKRTGHVTGQELADAVRTFAIDQFGPMARTVLNHWGVQNTSDIGEIVFNMVENGLMSKTDQDTRADFKDLYDFESAFNVFEKK